MHSSTILLSFWLLTWNVHLAVSFTVCPTKTRSLPKELHPIGFDNPSSPASCILFVFPLPVVVSSPALRALLIPELHLPGWKRSATGSSATSPHTFPPLELMGNAAFPPSLLPPPPSSPAPSCTAPCKIPTGEDLEREEGAGSAYFPVCISCWLPVPASRRSASGAGHAWDSVEIRFGKGSSGLTFDFLI